MRTHTTNVRSHSIYSKIILIVCSSGQVKNHKNFIFMGGTKNVQNTVLSFILIGKESFTINMIYIKDACFLKYM